MFDDLGKLPSVCMGHLSVKSAPRLMDLVNSTDALKKLCQRIDIFELGEDMFKLTMLDFEKKGADEKTLREFVPMFQLIIKVLEPIRRLPGLPKRLGGLVDDFRGLASFKEEEAIQQAKKKEVYEPLMKFLMDIRAQEHLLGKSASDTLPWHTNPCLVFNLYVMLCRWSMPPLL